MHPFEQHLTRAHRRFLGLALPEPASASVLLSEVTLAPEHLAFFRARLTGAGEAQGGIVLGSVSGPWLEVDRVLPGGVAMRGDPFALDGAYVLGAVEATRQGAVCDVDWVGHWVMVADGRLPGDAAVRRLWTRARSQALVGPERTLLIVGEHQHTLTVCAYAEDAGEPRPLTVLWRGDDLVTAPDRYQAGVR